MPKPNTNPSSHAPKSGKTPELDSASMPKVPEQLSRAEKKAYIESSVEDVWAQSRANKDLTHNIITGASAYCSDLQTVTKAAEKYCAEKGATKNLVRLGERFYDGPTPHPKRTCMVEEGTGENAGLYRFVERNPPPWEAPHEN